MAIFHRGASGSEAQPQSPRSSGGGGRWANAPFYEKPFDSAEEELGCWTPSVDILEDHDAVRLFIELPGLDKKDVSINVEGGVLTISGERQAPGEEKNLRYLRQERCYGSFCRSFSVNNLIDQEHISASMEKGMLIMTLPYKEGSKPKQIEVQIRD